MRAEEEVVSVWVDEWQQACCGTPFAVGDRVTWTLRADVDRPWLARVTSTAIAERIRWAEEHHGSAEETVEGSGVVRAVAVVRCRYEPDEVEHAFVPVPGSGTLTQVVASTERPASIEPDDHPGWVVDLASFETGRPGRASGARSRPVRPPYAGGMQSGEGS